MKAKRRSDWYNSQRGFLALIGLLAVIVIIGILFSIYYGAPGGGSGSKTVAGETKRMAQEVVCRNNLQQLRLAISAWQATNGSLPPSLESLKSGVPLTCPERDEPYNYDPTTGRVQCIHSGHEHF